MRVSVVLCTHTMDRYDGLAEAAGSVLDQTHDDVELVLVSDGDPAVHERMVADFGGRPDVRTHLMDGNVGLLGARNAGAEVATGDVVAFMDDDAVADGRWIDRLVAAYEERDRVAVGGRMNPAWLDGRPSFLPEEFYWIVGVTHRGFGPGGDPDREGEVRNTNGSNISFRREVFLDLGGFDTDIGGRKGDNHLQGGETELCARLWNGYGEGVWYVPDAEVAHKVFDYRTDPRWIAERAFWQGYSKRGMQKFTAESAGEEGAFLGRLLREYVPARLSRLLRRPSWEGVEQFLAVFVLTALVGVGYLYGVVKWR
ncbi:glycosyl transferase family A [Halobacteriales archaeon QS_5_70_15]|nr:MAG: glycosyl transferase family A [Halobacteriales archaeon QS_5_70_15]